MRSLSPEPLHLLFACIQQISSLEDGASLTSASLGRSLSRDMPITDLPEPLSPINPKISPLSIWNETSFTASTVPNLVLNPTSRCFTSRRDKAAHLTLRIKNLLESISQEAE